MDGAAFEHEGRPVSIGAFEFQDLVRDFVIAIPGKVQTAAKTAPGIEGPIDTAPPAPGVDDERRPAVAYPRIIAADFDDAHLGRQPGACILELHRRDAHGNRLADGDGGRDRRKHRLCGFGPAAPIVGAFRPQHPTARMPFELRGHAEAVLRRGRFQGAQYGSPLRSRMLALPLILQER